MLCRIGGHRCALPLGHIVETMRPLPVEPVAGAPAFVLGLAVIRGVPVPVVDGAALLGDRAGAPAPATRFITLRAGSRHAALAVGAVEGIERLDASALHSLPPLLGQAGGAVASVGALDAELLMVLETAHIIPESAWPGLAAERAP